MAADDILCTPPPAPVVDDQNAKTENVGNDASPPKSKKLIFGFLAFTLVAGVIIALAATRFSGSAATSASAEIVDGTEEPETETEGPAENVATATASGEVPKECEGEVADPQIRWYCTGFLPSTQKAAADHKRIDRLEAEVAELRSSQGSGVPLSVWFVLAGFGLLTAINTWLIYTLKRKKTEETPPVA